MRNGALEGRGPMTGRRRAERARRRAAAAAVGAAGAAITLSGCGGSGGGGEPTVNWYINNGLQQVVADRCSQESDQYDITTQLLPNTASGQREQLLRRLAANDKTIDVMSLDPPFMAEFANARFLRPFTEQEAAEFSEGVLRGPLEQSLYEETMYSAPFYGNTQLLWYRTSVAEQAGLDMSQPVTWEQLIAAAEQTGTTVAVQGRRNESLMVWVNALVESAGGTILDPASEGLEAAEVEATIDSRAGAAAAQIMSSLAASPAAPPALSTAGEEEARAAFQAEDGGFMVNWPYVWTAFDAAVEAGDLPADFKDDVAWARYPAVEAGTPSATPLGGIGLSIGAFTDDPELAVEAVRCLRSVESQVEYMLTAGDPGASAEVYADPSVQEAFPMHEAVQEGLTDAAPRPISAFYGDVTGAVQDTYHPPGSLSPERTPVQSAAFIEGVLSNEQLL